VHLLVLALLGRATHNSILNYSYEWNFFMSRIFELLFTENSNWRFNQPFCCFKLSGTAGYQLAPVNIMCAPQLAGLLACWSARGDYRSVGQCQETAEALFHCMRTSVRWTPVSIRVTRWADFISLPSFCYSRCRKKAIDQQLIITLHG